MKYRVLGLLFLFSYGCQSESAPEPASKERVVVNKLPAMQLRAGESATVSVSVDVNPGYHIQANPVPFAYLIPAELKLLDTAELTMGAPIYPAGKPYTLEGSTDTLIVYDGTVEIQVPVSVSASASAGHTEVSGTIRYQSCDDRMCFPPTSKPVQVAIEVVE